MQASANVSELPGLTREAGMIQVTLPDKRIFKLEVFTVRPEGPGPFPLVIINHGKSETGLENRAKKPNNMMGDAIHFARMGMACVMVMRRGYGNSEGSIAENDHPRGVNYIQSGNAAADDILSTLDELRKAPWVDSSRVLLVGISVGGIDVLAAAARHPEGVLGVINFSGGFGKKLLGPQHPRELLEALQYFGQQTQIPSLWLYAENDSYFNPESARAMYNAYSEAGGHAHYIAYGPYGEDGHNLGTTGIDVWQQDVGQFLMTLGLPSQAIIPLAELEAPPHATDKEKADFDSYQHSEVYEKAFAISPSGAWGWSTHGSSEETAKERALERCQKHTPDCFIYAVGNQVVQRTP
jgi:dienelactone hydrolase